MAIKRICKEKTELAKEKEEEKKNYILTQEKKDIYKRAYIYKLGEKIFHQFLKNNKGYNFRKA